MGTGSNEDGGTKVFDLTSPPSRADAGLPDGDSQVTHQGKDLKPFPVEVALPEGEKLAFDAKLVGFDAMGSPDPKTGPVTTMDIQYYAPTLEAGRDHLVAALRQFQLDEATATSWYTQASAVRAAKKADDVRTPWRSTTLGYLKVTLQGGYLSVGEAPGQTVVHYVLSWSSPQ